MKAKRPHRWIVLVMAGLAAGLLQVSCESPAGGSEGRGSAPGLKTGGKPADKVADNPAEKPADKVAEKAPVSAVAEQPPVAAESAVVPVKVPVPVPETAPVVSPPEGTISQMDLGTLFELQGAGRVLLVDVRPALFYNLDHIPGAISLPLKSYDALIAEKKPELDAAVAAGKVIVLYCTDEDCPDGRSTAQKLAKAGYSSSVYRGGWKEWKDSGL